MNRVKYLGLDVHQATISIAVLDSEGRLVMQSVLDTRAVAILDFIRGLRGSLQVTFEEGTHSAWLYDLLVRRVDRVVVCNPRRNALLEGLRANGNRTLYLCSCLQSRAERQNPAFHRTTPRTRGWTSKNSRPSVMGEVFSLDIPFYRTRPFWGIDGKFSVFSSRRRPHKIFRNVPSVTGFPGFHVERCAKQFEP
jgi:hypothetical protein